MPFRAFPTDVDERPLAGERPPEIAERLARAKARAGAIAFPGHVAVGADTVVAMDDEPLGKPATPAEAVAMLRRLRAREHRVITAVATAHLNLDTEPAGWHGVNTTRVWMRSYSDVEIEAYVASGDPLDKAGGYAIQHVGFHPVERLDGCFLNVVGLPLPELCEALDAAGLEVPRLQRSGLDRLCPGCKDVARLPLQS